MLIKIESGVPVGAPITEENFKYLFTEVAWPLILTAAMVEPYGYAMYDFSQVPATGAYQKVVEAAPVKDAHGIWRQQWNVVALAGAELTARQALEAERFQQMILASVQKRLDDFARTRNYDGILSACTYATSAVPKFASEAAYCVQARDATWSAMYAAFAEVQTGTRPMPSSFADVEVLLPALAWPA